MPDNIFQIINAILSVLVIPALLILHRIQISLALLVQRAVHIEEKIEKIDGRVEKLEIKI